MNRDIIISIKTILFTLLLIFGIYVIYRLGPVLAILLIALLIVISVEHWVKFFMSKTLMNKPISRSLAVLFTYFFLILTVVTIVTIGLPPVIQQAQKLLMSLSQVLQNLNIATDSTKTPLVSGFIPQFSDISKNVLSATFSVFSNVLGIFSILVLSIYISLDWENIKSRINLLLPQRAREDFLDTVNEIEVNVGRWVKGELVLMFIVGLMCLVGLVSLKVSYPLALALIAGLLEIVPIVGPLISAALAGVIGFVDSPIKGFAVLVLYLVVQQTENNFLVPKIMQKVSGFSPLIILIALLIGSHFFGIAGAVMAVPLTMISAIIVKRVLRYKN